MLETAPHDPGRSLLADGHALHALRVSGAGVPWHPLYLHAGTKAAPWHPITNDKDPAR